MPRKKPQEARPLTLSYIPLSQARTWERNPKRHDIEAIARSIVQYGFLDPPKFDSNLNDGAGGLVEGNGRTEALLWMQAQGQELPRGLAVDPESQEWLVPVLFGVDAESQMAAQAYAVDHNNLVLSGGNFTVADLVGLWDESEYARILTGLAQEQMSPITVSADDLDRLASLRNGAYSQGAHGEQPYPAQPYEPSTSPEMHVRDVGEGDMERAAGRLDKQFQFADGGQIQVQCPGCGEIFYVDRG